MAEPVSSEANRVETSYVELADWSEDPASPTMIAIPVTNPGDFQHVKNTVESQRLRSDAMLDSILEVGVEAPGGFQAELVHSDFQTPMEHLLRTTAVSVNIAAASDIGTTSPDTITSSTTDFVAEGIVVGMNIKTAGFANSENNGPFKVVTVSANSITISQALGEALTTEAAGASVTITAKMIRNGTLRKAVAFELGFLDVSQYIWYPRNRFTQLRIEATAQRVVEMRWQLMGEQGQISDTSKAGSLVAASTDTPMTTSVNIGQVLSGGSTLVTAWRMVGLEVTNNARMLPVGGSKFTRNINYGTFDVTMRTELYFESAGDVNDFLNHSATSLSWRATDEAGNISIYTMPRGRIIEGWPQPQNINTDTMIQPVYRAERDPVTNCMLQVDYL